jgi:putative transposase
MNIQIDYIHLIAMIPPKVAVSRFIGRLKGKNAILVFSHFIYLKKSVYWGNHF